MVLNVKVRSFSGAKTTDMMYYTKPAMDENAELYIMHCGTNDLRSDENPQEKNEAKMFSFLVDFRLIEDHSFHSA